MSIIPHAAAGWGANMFILVENSGKGLNFGNMWKYIDEYNLGTSMTAMFLVAVISIVLAVYLD